MVLLDTSVWVRFLCGQEPFFSKTRTLLLDQQAAGHELVYGELLMGDWGGRRGLLADYVRMHQVKRIAHAEVVSLVQPRRLGGRGIGWIDVHLLASALAARVPLWTADTRLTAIAEELDVGYRLHHA
ncbi:MAG TPA: PIN domain-containing protein [Bryobacteraceae bacterium]|nr:PIN domain-containing protein [Bryobacteraceae bacterium]